MTAQVRGQWHEVGIEDLGSIFLVGEQNLVAESHLYLTSETDLREWEPRSRTNRENISLKTHLDRVEGRSYFFFGVV